jgi:hypothetical protein
VQEQNVNVVVVLKTDFDHFVCDGKHSQAIPIGTMCNQTTCHLQVKTKLKWTGFEGSSLCARSRLAYY